MIELKSNYCYDLFFVTPDCTFEYDPERIQAMYEKHAAQGKIATRYRILIREQEPHEETQVFPVLAQHS